MNYASIRSMDISNGEGIGISLFVTGCPFHCKNCFNSELWDSKNGKLWTPRVEKLFLSLAAPAHISRISILGGEPLADENVQEILNLVEKIKEIYPNKKVWLYSGYTWEEVMYSNKLMDDKGIAIGGLRYSAMFHADVVVDGQFIDELKNLKLKWRGSSNQRVIDVRESVAQNKIIKFCD